VAADIAKEIAEVTHAAGNMSNSSSQVNLNAEQLSRLATSWTPRLASSRFNGLYGSRFACVDVKGAA